MRERERGRGGKKKEEEEKGGEGSSEGWRIPGWTQRR
jgi:hypothetical protein